MNNSQFPVARKSGLVVQEVPDELLVYDLDNNKAHCLNKTAALVWKSCDGSKSIADIARIVGKDSSGSVTDDFVWLAIDQLSESKLLEQEMRASFGQSRREVIKKIGLATMVGLPIIASLVAPSATFGSISSCQNCTDIGGSGQCSAVPGCQPCCGSGGACVAAISNPSPGVFVCPSSPGRPGFKAKKS